MRSQETPNPQSFFYRPLSIFYSQEEKSLIERYNLLEKLIGVNTFNLGAGYLCENLLKEYLRTKFPNRYSIDSGFVRGILATTNPCDAISPQIDILMHEEACYAPLFRTGDYVVVEPESVHAVIEVKKTLNEEMLERALQNVFRAHSVSTRGRTNPAVFSGVFSFSADKYLTKEKIECSLRKAVEDRLVLPDSIAILNYMFLNIEYNNGTYNIAGFIKKESPSQNMVLYSLQGFLYCMLNVTSNACGMSFERFNFDSAAETTDPISFSIEVVQPNT